MQECIAMDMRETGNHRLYQALARYVLRPGNFRGEKERFVYGKKRILMPTKM